MVSTYSVYLGDSVVGSMQLDKSGLYYRFCCRCQLESGTIFTVMACCGDSKQNLGICIPYGKYFGLQTSLPIKKFGEGDWTFVLMPKHKTIDHPFYPVRADEPFAYLDKLQNAYLSRKNGQLGIILPEPARDQQDSDLNP